MVNIDNLKPSAFASIFEAAGLDKLAYKPQQAATSVDAWPTLGTLIDADTPLVVFMDNSADFTATPYIIDEFTNMWEDAYSESACVELRRGGASTSLLAVANSALGVFVVTAAPSHAPPLYFGQPG